MTRETRDMLLIAGAIIAIGTAVGYLLGSTPIGFFVGTGIAAALFAIPLLFGYWFVAVIVQIFESITGGGSKRK